MMRTAEEIYADIADTVFDASHAPGTRGSAEALATWSERKAALWDELVHAVTLDTTAPRWGITAALLLRDRIAIDARTGRRDADERADAP